MLCARVVLVVWLAGCGRIGFDPEAPVLFSDGFEGPLTPTWTQDGETTGTARVTAPMPVHGGSGALFARTATETPASVQVAFEPAITTPGQLDARAWFYAPAGFGGTQIQLLTLFGDNEQDMDSNSGLATIQVTKAGQLGGFVWAHDIGQDLETAVALPTGQWFCLELRVVLSTTATGNVEVRCNDEPINMRVPSFTTLQSTGYEGVAVGLATISPGSMATEIVYVDDVVAAHGPIGCTPPGADVLPRCSAL